jgi:hypothetical protein
LDHIINEYFPGALVCLVAIIVLAVATRRPIPPPGTPWPMSRRRRRHLDDVGSDEPIVIDAEVLDRVDESTAAALRELSRRAHPSYRPPTSTTVRQLPPRRSS